MDSPEQKFFVSDDGKEKLSITKAELQAGIDSGKHGEKSLAWTKGMSVWLPLSDPDWEKYGIRILPKPPPPPPQPRGKENKPLLPPIPVSRTGKNKNPVKSKPKKRLSIANAKTCHPIRRADGGSKEYRSKYRIGSRISPEKPGGGVQNSHHDFWVAILLVLFFGNMGLHRFYVGRIASGVVMLLTCGGVGIWWLIDICILISGNFTDSLDRQVQSTPRPVIQAPVRSRAYSHAPSSHSGKSKMTTVDEIEKYAELRDKGILTNEEFTRKKRALLRG